MIAEMQAPPLTPPIVLTVAGEITIDADMPLALRCAIIEALTLDNPLFLESEQRGRDTRDLEPELCYYRHAPDGGLVVPRGAGRLVQALCAEHDMVCEIVDDTHSARPVLFDERVRLSPAQERAVGQVLTRRIGVLEAPAGSGKTIMAMALIARRQQPALIIVHTKELAHQAIARAVAVLGLDEGEIGLVGDGQCTVGARLTVALVQTLARPGGIPPALLDVGHVVVDECHHCPAAHMAAVVSQFPARFVTGLTATPFRRDKLDAVIAWYVGEIVARIDKEDLADRLITPRIIKRDTSLHPRGDSFAEIVSDLVAMRARNALIVEDVAQAVADGRRCLVLSERVNHVEELTRLLRARGIAAAALYGSLGKKARGRVVEDLADGALAVVVATISLIAEGFDAPRLDGLFLTTPMSYGGRVVQAIGRVSRTAPGKEDAIVVDYTDDNRLLWATWRNRKGVYDDQGAEIHPLPGHARTPGHARARAS